MACIKDQRKLKKITSIEMYVLLVTEVIFFVCHSGKGGCSFFVMGPSPNTKGPIVAVRQLFCTDV